MPTDKKGSELTYAAAELDSELKRFDDLSELSRKIKLSSEKNLDRAAKAIADAAASQEKVGARVGALVQAIANSRTRQEANAQALVARAEEIRERRGKLAAVQESFGVLGEEAKAINALVQQIAAERKDQGEAGSPAGLLGKLEAVQTRMAGVEEEAAGLAKRAAADELEDVARQADSLRQQIHGARNKVKLLQASLKGA